MNTASLTPLITAQPKPYVNAKGVEQDYVVVYKDEGGKYIYHYTMCVDVSRSTHTVSVAAFAQCVDPMCARHFDIYNSPKFVSDQLFRVRECGRAGYKGPLPPAPCAVGAWRNNANVWSYKTSMDGALVIKCNFLKVSSKCMCPTCGGETRFKIAVATNDNCSATSFPICVMSKRKIPAHMRAKSQKEIEAFMGKSRCKKTGNTHKRKNAAAARPIQKRKKRGVGVVQQPEKKRASTTTEDTIRAMTISERNAFIETQNACINELNTKVKSLEFELAKQQQLLAVYENKKANQRQEVNAIMDDDARITPRTNCSDIYATPPTYLWPSDGDRVPIDPISLYDNVAVANLPDIEEELDFDNWDLA